MELELRAFVPDDAPALAAAADYPEIGQNLRDGFPSPYTVADGAASIAAFAEGEGKRGLTRAIVVDGVVSGCMSATFGENVYRKNVEIGYFLMPTLRGRGLMPRAIRLLCGEVFACGDFVRIFAEPYGDNAASRRALEKAGFVLEGVLRDSVWKNGTLRDSCMYALLKRDWRNG